MGDSGPLKRCRSPTHSASMSWAEFDADLLDNMRANKRFAVNIALGSDFASKMSMASAGPLHSPSKSAPSRPALSGPLEAVSSSFPRPALSGYDGMAISSAECSPTVTPTVQRATDPFLPNAIPGWSTPQRQPSALGSSGAAAAAGMTSPSDPLDTQDLRRIAMRRLAVRRSEAPTADDMATPAAAAAAVEPVISAAATRRRSRLARSQHAQQETSLLGGGDGSRAMETSPIKVYAPSRQ